ncbi:MAG: hypothetical protein ACERKD_03080 [Prolixibacteraceae bacterium]
MLNASIVYPCNEEELALTLAGKRKKLKWEHFIPLGNELGLTEKNINAAFNRIKRNIPKAM